MPFFQPSYLTPEASIFHQLLAELDQPTHKAAVCHPQQRPAETFTPRFDITERSESYDLYGELPGISQDDLSIEFSDAQTIVVKGKTERVLTTEAPTSEKAKGKGKEVDTASASVKSHNPTVEDEYDDVDTPVTSTTTTAVPEPKQTETPAAPRPKFWVSERKVGEFARSFTFSQRIEPDFVSADLKNGVLHVVVPKSQKSRKVAVAVN